MTGDGDSFLTVHDKGDALENIISFNQALSEIDKYQEPVRKTLVRLLSTAEGWVAVAVKGRWLVAPVKYAAFQGIDPELFYARRKVLPAAAAVSAMQRLLSPKPVDHGHGAYMALAALAERLKRPLHERARVFMLAEQPGRVLPAAVAKELPEGPSEAPACQPVEEAAIEALVRFAATLTPDALAVLKSRLAALEPA